MQRIMACAVLLLALILLACDKNFNPYQLPDENEEVVINPNIVQLINSHDSTDYYEYVSVSWCQNIIFSVMHLKQFNLDDDCSVIDDKMTRFPYHLYWRYIESNSEATRLLAVDSNYSRFAVVGALYEIDTDTWDYTMLLDSTYMVSSAVYWHGDDSKLVYYRYGSEAHPGAGYYLYDKNSGESDLLYSYMTADSIEETINGFDLHPDNSKLLIPVTDWRRTRTFPYFCEYNLNTGALERLPVEMTPYFFRYCLRGRYNSTGSQILYCHYCPDILYGFVMVPSEIGIIELPSMETRVLDTNVNRWINNWSTHFDARWSPDDKHIVFTGGWMDEYGYASEFNLYILLNVN